MSGMTDLMIMMEPSNAHLARLGHLLDEQKAKENIISGDGAAYAYWGLLDKKTRLTAVLKEIGRVQGYLEKDHLMTEELMTATNSVALAVEEELVKVETGIKRREKM